MNAIWTLPTQGDPLGTVRRVLRHVWDSAGLDAMLAPTNGAGGGVPRLLQDVADLDGVNPFQPLMTTSTARLLPGFMTARPLDLLGVIARPCELRGLVEMTKHDGFSMENLVTVCVDCLSTLPPDEYRWRASRQRASDDVESESVTSEALRMARHGGLVPYRYRSACQQCGAPQSGAADVNIGVLGLPAREFLLVWSRDEGLARRYGLDRLPVRAAAAREVTARQRVVDQLIERRARGRQRAHRSLGGEWGHAPGAVAALLDGCGPCQACLDACPITAVEPLERAGNGRFSPDAVAHWLVSCDGCGMCEEACPQHLPLAALFGSVRDRLAGATGYSPGRSVAEPVPV